MPEDSFTYEDKLTRLKFERKPREGHYKIPLNMGASLELPFSLIEEMTSPERYPQEALNIMDFNHGEFNHFLRMNNIQPKDFYVAILRLKIEELRRNPVQKEISDIIQ